MGGGKCQVRPPNCQGEATQHCAVLVVLPWLSHTPGDCVVFCMIPLRLFLGLRSYIGLLFNFQPFIMHSIVTFKRTASKIYVNHGFQPLKWLYRKRNYFFTRCSMHTGHYVLLNSFTSVTGSYFVCSARQLRVVR